MIITHHLRITKPDDIWAAIIKAVCSVEPDPVLRSDRVPALPNPELPGSKSAALRKILEGEVSICNGKDPECVRPKPKILEGK